jgi:hypothetical protein
MNRVDRQGKQRGNGNVSMHGHKFLTAAIVQQLVYDRHWFVSFLSSPLFVDWTEKKRSLSLGSNQQACSREPWFIFY